MGSMILAFDVSNFLGRFHPVLVHLPIGIMLVGILLEWRGKTSHATLTKLWFYGAMSAIASAAAGWMLADSASYAPGTLSWHKWLGIVLCVISTLIWLSYRAEEIGKGMILITSRVLVAGLLLFGGHLGGTLTHGDGFLVAAAPDFIKKIAGYDDGEPVDLSVMPVDSVETYAHLIRPLLEKKCLSCHNAKSANGGLDLSSIDALTKGGDNGHVIIATDAGNSEIFKRVTLAQSSIKFMPPKGIPLSYHEIELLKWWINNGASFQERTAEQVMSAELIAQLQHEYKVDFTPRPWYEKELVTPADESVLEQVMALGYQVNRLSQDNNFLMISSGSIKELSNLGLAACKDQVLFLDLKNVSLSAEASRELSELSNLSRLQLSNSNITSEAIVLWPSLPRLATLNLYGTAVDDRGLEHLINFPALQKIYLWQTKVTPEGIDKFKKARADVELVMGS